MLKRINIYFLIGLYALSLVAFSLNPFVANAASPYDTTVSVASNLIIDNQSDSYDPIDITTNYMGYITGDLASYNQCESDCRDYISGSIDVGSWYVTQVYSGSPMIPSYVCAFFTQEVGFNLEFFSNSTYNRLFFSSLPPDFRRVCMYPSGSGNVNTLFDSSDLARQNITTSFVDVRPYVNTFPIVYPAGYEGELVPDVAGPTELVRPQFSWDVVLRTIKIRDLNQVPSDMPTDYRIRYDIVVGEIPDQIDLYTLILDKNTTSEVIDLGRTVPISITAYYINFDGTRLEDTDEYTFTETIVVIPIDGTSFYGSTVGSDCNDDNVCTGGETTGVPDYKDCSQYNTTIVFFPGMDPLEVWSLETLSCEINNFWLRLNDFLAFLFVPDLQAIQRAFDTFLSVLESKLGFVYTSFEYIIEWITSIVSAGPDCTIDTGSGTFFGASIDYDFCTFENAALTVWNLAINFTRLLFAAGLIFLSYNRLFSIIKGLGK